MSSVRKTTLDDFEVICQLGKGSFGSVSKVKRLMDQQFYVIKSIPITELSYKEQSESINEVKILSQMDSPYVVKYLDSFIQTKCLYIVMEYCDKGDLQKLIKKAKSKDMSCIKENVVWNIILQVILGLYYIHSKKVLHRDLKSANVFLKKPSNDFDSNNNSNDDHSSKTFFDVKIGDLGVSKLLESSTAFAQTIVGTPYYLSPELCSDAPYRDKSDCWALGILVYECCTLKHPFEAKNQFALIMKILRAQYEPLNEETSSTYMYNLVTWLLQKNPTQRPTIRDLLCEKYVRRQLEQNSFLLPVELEEGEVLVTDYLSDLSQLSLLIAPVSCGLNDSNSSGGSGRSDMLTTPISAVSDRIIDSQSHLPISKTVSPRDSGRERGSGKGSKKCDYDREVKREMNGGDYTYDDENEDGNHSTYSDASQFKTAMATVDTNKQGGIRINQEETKVEAKEDHMTYFNPNFISSSSPIMSSASTSGKANILNSQRDTVNNNNSNNNDTNLIEKNKHVTNVTVTKSIINSGNNNNNNNNSNSNINRIIDSNRNASNQREFNMIINDVDSVTGSSPRVICVSKSLPNPPPHSLNRHPHHLHHQQQQQQMVKDTALIKGGGRVRGNLNKNAVMSSVARTRHQVSNAVVNKSQSSIPSSSSSSSSSSSLRNQQQYQQQYGQPIGSSSLLTKHTNNNNNKNNNNTNKRENKIDDHDDYNNDNNNDGIGNDTFIRRSNNDKYESKLDDDDDDDGDGDGNNNGGDEDDYGDVAPREYHRIQSNYKKYDTNTTTNHNIGNNEDEEDSFDEFLDTFGGVAGERSSGRGSGLSGTDSGSNNNNYNNISNNKNSNSNDNMDVEDEYSTNFNTFNSNSSSSSSGMMKDSLEDSQETDNSAFSDDYDGDGSRDNDATNNNNNNYNGTYSGSNHNNSSSSSNNSNSSSSNSNSNTSSSEDKYNQYYNILPVAAITPSEYKAEAKVNVKGSHSDTLLKPPLPKPPASIRQQQQRQQQKVMNSSSFDTSSGNDNMSEEKQSHHYYDFNENDDWKEQQESRYRDDDDSLQPHGIVHHTQNENEEFVNMANRTRNKLLSDLGVDLFRKVYNLLKGLSTRDELLQQSRSQYITADSRIIQELQHQLSEHTHFNKIEDLCSSVNRVKLLLALEQQPQLQPRIMNSR